MSWLLRPGLQDVVEVVGSSGDLFELRIAFAAVIVQSDDLEVAGVFDDQLDGRAGAFAS